MKTSSVPMGFSALLRRVGRSTHLMGELLQDHICSHMPRNSKSSEEAANDVIEIVRTYLQ